jgi:hypothetical protein
MLRQFLFTTGFLCVWLATGFLVAICFTDDEEKNQKQLEKDLMDLLKGKSK